MNMPERRDTSDWFVRHRLKIRHLNVLLAVERCRSVGRAARDLRTSQPAVSKALHEIEHAVGTALFERRSNGTFPTDAGDALIRYAREVFGVLDRAGQDVEALSSGRGGVLTIGCNFSSATFLVPRAVSLLKRSHPSVSVKIREGSLEALLPDLRARHADVLVARWPRGRHAADLQEHETFEQPMCVVCAPGHPLARSKRLTWSALASQPWILPPAGSPARDDLEELFRIERIKPKEAGIECASVFANGLLMRELGALTVAPASVAQHLQEEHLFAILPIRLPAVFGPNSAITLRGREHTPAMTSFIRCLTDAAGER